MRMIGHVDGEARARNFGDYLFVQGIENQLEPDKAGRWAVWIHREEDLERGRALLNNYTANPDDPRFQNNTQAAEELREQKKREQAEYEKRVKQRRHLFRPMAAYGFGPVTFVLISISVIVFFRSKFGVDFKPIYDLFISTQDVPGAPQHNLLLALLRRISDFKEALPEIRHGQLWRLITPIFIHMDIIHIFFNMLWLRDLGSMIEARQGSLFFFIQVLVLSLFSNLGQFLMNGPAFGGMSGVIYGLFGYIWIRGKRDPASGLYLHPTTVVMMIVWFFVCLIGFEGGRVANAAHAFGLLVGMAWGFLSSLGRK